MDDLRKLQETTKTELPLNDYLAAISVGIVDGEPLLDLCYVEDFGAQVDFNVVMTGTGKIVEVQGTAEESPFTKDEMEQLLVLAEKGINQLIDLQREVLTPDLAEKYGGVK